MESDLSEEVANGGEGLIIEEPVSTGAVCRSAAEFLGVMREEAFRQD